MGSKRNQINSGFVARFAEWSLVMKSAGDDWADLRHSSFCDESLGTRCLGGCKIRLAGSRSNSFLTELACLLQGPLRTSSAKAEAIECRRAVRATLRFKSIWDACRLVPVRCNGNSDKNALRLAVVEAHQLSKLGHLRVHAEMCFLFFAQIPISLHRVDTTENEADTMTKALSTTRHRELCIR